MDVVALAQHGVDYAVASLGTATTSEQLQTLFRTVKEVICCYDGDRAGRDAAWRAMDNALPMIQDGFSLKFVFLPDGEDPDSLIREQGQAAFETILDNATPLSQFLFDHLLAQLDMSSAEGKGAAIGAFQPYLAKLPDSNLKDAIVTTLANQFGASNETQLKKLQKSFTHSGANKAKTKRAKITPIRLAIALLLEHPHIVETLPDPSILNALDIPGLPLLNSLLALCKQNPNVNSAQLIEHYRGQEEGKQLTKIMCIEHHVEAENAESTFLDIIEKFLNIFLENRTDELLDKQRTQGLTKIEIGELHGLLSAQK